MKKKIIAVFVSFFMVACMSGVAFAANEITVELSYTHSGSFEIKNQESLTTSVTLIVPDDYAGHMVRLRLNDFNAVNYTGTGIFHISNDVSDISFGVESVVGSDGLPLPYWIVDSGFICVYVPDVYPNVVTLTVSIFNGSGDSVSTTLYPMDTCPATDLGEVVNMTLNDFLYGMDYSLGEIDATLQVMRQYLYWVKDESTESNQNLDNIIGKLEWIVAEMEGQANASIGAMGEYTGYNYSQLFVEMINAIKNISIGDISGNITVQTDLSQVIENLITVSNAYNNINQFDYTGKMYFRPVSVVARQYVKEGTPKIVNPTIQYHTMVGLPSFTLGSVQNVVYCDTFNMKMGINENTTFPLMPGRYRFRIRILAPDYYSNVDTMSQTQVYFYNTQIGWVHPEWNSTGDAYNSGYITHSCEFVIDVPAGNYPGSLQLSNSAGMLVLGSKITVEVTDLDRTQTDILASTQQIEHLLARNNELLAGLTGTVENGGLSDAMQDFDGYENDAQTNFEDHMTVVDDAMSTITGVTTSDYMTSVVSFINGNFTSIWEALGRFKYLIILNLLAGLALVFVGRSGKVK